MKAVVLALLVAARAAHADDVEVVDLTPQPVVEQTLRVAEADLPDQLPAAVLAVVGAAVRAGLDPAGPPFARYLSRGATYVVEVGIPVRVAPRRAPRGLTAATLPGGPAATLVHRGPHAELPRAHAALDAWLAAHHRTAAGPRWEIYLDPSGPTRIVAPLAR